MTEAAAKFGADRAAEYERQSRIALAGYEACHELAACLLVAALGEARPRHLLVVGAGGTAQEIQTLGRLQPDWQFTAVDPSPPMLDQALQRLQQTGLDVRTQAVLGEVQDVPLGRRFDAATLVGVLHHLPGSKAKQEILRAIADRLPAGAPLILAGNAWSYASRPLFLKAWAQRWRMFGADEGEVQAKLSKILQGADPPASEVDALALLEQAGFSGAERYFSSLFWTGWIAFKA